MRSRWEKPTLLSFEKKWNTNPMPRPRKPGIPHSDFPGVVWQKGKWHGKVYDRSVRVGKKAKSIHVGYFVDEQACADATATKQAEVEAAIAQKLHAMAQELEHTRGLPPRPKRPVDAAPETAYYGEKSLPDKKGEPKEFVPTRLVRVTSKSKPGGFDFLPCCRGFLDSGAPCVESLPLTRAPCRLGALPLGAGARCGLPAGHHHVRRRTRSLRQVRQGCGSRLLHACVRLLRLSRREDLHLHVMLAAAADRGATLPVLLPRPLGAAVAARRRPARRVAQIEARRSGGGGLAEGGLR